jgi:hypothetical protein
MGHPVGNAEVKRDRQRQRQGQEQIPSLRCGMTNKRTGNSNGKGKMRVSTAAADAPPPVEMTTWG